MVLRIMQYEDYVQRVLRCKMKYRDLWLVIFSIVSIRVMASECGCRHMQSCYRKMLEDLRDEEEAFCIEDAEIGSSTVTLFLKALSKYCEFLVNATSEHITYDGRHLYEVIIEPKAATGNVEGRPTIIIEAGQEAGTESVGLALYLIEQLTACAEHFDMVDKVRWVILPSTNPDGQEYSRYKSFAQTPWKKNCRTAEDKMSIGVDITRNFDTQWNSCPKVTSGFSSSFPGLAPASENETIFIKNVITKHKKYAKLYLSIKRNGHFIGYPHAYTKNSPTNSDLLKRVAGEVAAKVNQRASGVHLFSNNSIYEFEGRPHCGHSVDFAFDSGIPLAFEMRVFLGSDNRIMSKFQTLPRGYETSLRNGYFSGIRELYNVIVNEKKYGKIQ